MAAARGASIRDQRSGAGNEAVEKYRNPGRRAGHHRPGKRRNLESTDLAQHVERIRWVGFKAGQRRLDDPRLVGDGSLIDPRARSGYRGYVGIEYEGSKVNAYTGIKKTKQLLEAVRDELS